jgi:hypothetical protein
MQILCISNQDTYPFISERLAICDDKIISIALATVIIFDKRHVKKKSFIVTIIGLTWYDTRLKHDNESFANNKLNSMK